MRVKALHLLLLGSVLLSSFSLAQDQEQPSAGDLKETPVPPEINDIKLLAQRYALPSLKGDDKFTLRESWWSGQDLAPGEAKLIQVQLFRRNAYRFWFAVPFEKAGLNFNIYDSQGNLAQAEPVPYDPSNIEGLFFQPESSGVYYIRISLKTTIEMPQDWAVIYAYR